MNIPKRITAGDQITWFDHPWLDAKNSTRCGSAEWLLSYELRGQTQLTAVTVADGDGWKTTIDHTASATLLAGTYVWGAYLNKADGGSRLNIACGTVTVLPNLVTLATPIDGRSLARKALDDCEAALATFTKSGGKIKSYTIATRTTEFHSLQELMDLHAFWQRKVSNEQAREAIRNGRGNPRTLLVRFR